MAFFNLTHLGVEEPFRHCLKDKSSNSAGNATSKPEPQHSHKIYRQRVTKHQRPNHAPNEIYRKPITSSQEHGWWMEKAKDGSAENSLGWARVERRARIDSEMTRFVDQMALTDKKFSLF